jgi:ribonucleoside-diphosphate reductase alpha chain
MAKIYNKQIFKHIHDKTLEADHYLCDLRGPCPDAQKAGVSRRFSHLTAIAPNASSSLIMGNTSPSIEPYRANVFRQDTLSGAHVYKNRFLKKTLDDLGMDTDQVWSSIIAQGGSVQHLDLPEHTKAVFKTAMEIDQQWIIELAADRQEFISQGQSVNLFFRPDVSIKYLHTIHYSAWAKGLKSLYYARSEKIRRADAVGTKIKRVRIEEEIDLKAVAEDTTCLACEG